MDVDEAIEKCATLLKDAYRNDWGKALTNKSEITFICEKLSNSIEIDALIEEEA